MITILSVKDLTNGKRVVAYMGLSTDTKPENDGENGSTFWEIDTATCYQYDEENQTWHKEV